MSKRSETLGCDSGCGCAIKTTYGFEDEVTGTEIVQRCERHSADPEELEQLREQLRASGRTESTSKIEISIEDAEAIAKVLHHLEEATKALIDGEAWIDFPIRVTSELVSGIEGSIGFHDSGILTFRPGAPEPDNE